MVTMQLSWILPYITFQEGLQENRNSTRILPHPKKTLYKWIRRLLWFQCGGFVMKHLTKNVATLVIMPNSQKSSTTTERHHYLDHHYDYYWNLLSMSVWVLFILWLLCSWIFMRQPSFLWRFVDYSYCHTKEEHTNILLPSGWNNLLERSKESANKAVSIYAHISFRNVFMSAQESLCSIAFRNHVDNDDNNRIDDHDDDTTPLVEQYPLLDEHNNNAPGNPKSSNIIASSTMLEISKNPMMIGSPSPIHNSASSLTLATPFKHATMTAPCPKLIDRNTDEWQGHHETTVKDHQQNDLE